MNKVMLFSITTLILLGVFSYLYFQNTDKSNTQLLPVPSPSPVTSSPSPKKAIIRSLPIDSNNAEGAFMQNGKIFHVEGHVLAEMLENNSITLSNGSIVKGNGEIVENDGTRYNLKEGQLYYFERF